MDITGIVRSIEPIFTSTHELARAIFHIDGVPSPFIAFGSAASSIYDAAFTKGQAHVIARSSVMLRGTQTQALLVNSVEAV